MTTPIKQVMAHWGLLHHSTVDLLANSVSSQPCMFSQRRAESRRNKRVSYHKSWSIKWRWLLPPPTPHPRIWFMHLIVGSALSVDKICILFWKTKMSNFKTGFKQTKSSGRRSASISDWPEIAYFVKLISNIFQLVDRGHNPRHGIWNKSTTQYISFVSV